MTTLKGVFPCPKPVVRKNFIQENVKNLKRMEQYFHSNRELEQKMRIHVEENMSTRKSRNTNDLKKEVSKNNINSSESGNKQLLSKKYSDYSLPPKIHFIKKYKGTVSSDKTAVNQQNCLYKSVSQNQNYLHKNINQSQKQIKQLSVSQSSLNKSRLNNNKSFLKLKNQGCQTLESDEMDGLYENGVIRYPSIVIKKNNKKNISGSKVQTNYDKHIPSDKGDAETTQKQSKKQLVATEKNNSNQDHFKTNHRIGVVPKYLKDRKETLMKELNEKIAATKSDCPKDYITLSDAERKETLQLLQKGYQDLVNELNMLPIKSDTLKSQKRKIEIEKQLSNLENGIKLFSKSKVYVKVDECDS